MAYISKFTGAQIDDLLDKSKTMGAAVDELAQDVAAKEDAANKVTSITASADDTHYPTAKAVKTALTNLADGEDLASVGNVMKLADKAYAPTAYSGMGRKYLRKNLVDGKNILTQEMLPSANTIYIIQYDYDLNRATITIPENCTLEFQGGSLANGTVNLNFAIIKGEGIRTKFINPQNNVINTRTLVMGNDSVYDTEMMGYICSLGCDIIVNTKSITINESINVTKDISIIGEIDGEGYEFVPFIDFPNSNGFLFTAIQNNNNGIKNLKIQALGDVLHYSNVYMYFWENLNLISKQGNCISADSSFHARFNRIKVSAPETGKAGFKGFRGNTTTWTNCTSDSCFAVFMQCRGLIESYNGTWGNSQHFIYDDEAVVGYGRQTTIKNSNIESFKDTPIVLKAYSDQLILDNVSIYNYPTDGVYTHDTIAIDYIALLELRNGTTLSDVGNGYYAIRTKQTYSLVKKIVGYSGYIYSEAAGLLHCSIDSYIDKESSTATESMYFNRTNIYANKLITKGSVYKETEWAVADADNSITITDIIDCYGLKATNDDGQTKQISITAKPYGISASALGRIVTFINRSTNSSINIGLYGNSWTIAPKQYCSYYIHPISSNMGYVPKSWNGYERIFAAATRPTGLTSFNGGVVIYDNVLKMPLYWNGTAWCAYNGINMSNVTAIKGTTETRNSMTLNSSNAGFQYFDTTLNKPIWWTGSAWVDATGATV